MYRWLTALLMGFALVITFTGLTACKHGDDPMAPTITSLTPASGHIGVAGETVVCNVSATGAGTLTYFWLVSSGGGTFSAFTSATTNLTLGAAGSYVASVAVTDSGGTTTGTINFTVDDAGITINGITPDGIFGLPAGETVLGVDYDGVATDATWTFDDGTVEATIGGLTPTVHLKDPGSYSGTVVLENAITTTDPFDFDFEVTAPVAPNWTRMVLGQIKTQTQTTDASVAATLHDGKLAIVASTNEGIKLFRALVDFPCCPSDWFSHVIDPEGPSGAGPNSIVSYNHRLIVAYFKSTTESGSPADRLAVAVSTLAEPTDAAEWTTYLMGIGGSPLTFRVAMAALSNGDLAMVLSGGASYLSSNVIPETVGDWSAQHYIAPTSRPANTDKIFVSEHDGKIYVSAGPLGGSGKPGAEVYVSDDLSPTENGDWTGSGLSRGVADGDEIEGSQLTNLFFWNELPCSIYTTGYFLDPGHIILRQADSAVPDALEDWTNRHELFQGTGGLWIGTALLDANRALVPFADVANSRIALLRQTRIALESSGSWELQPVDSTDSPALSYVVPIVIQGRIALAYTATASSQLVVSISDGSY